MMSRFHHLRLLSFELFCFIGQITAVIVNVPINASPVTIPATVTFTGIPTIAAATPLFRYATTNTSVGTAGTTFVYESAAYISPDPGCVTTLPVTTTTSAGTTTTTTVKPYCAVVTVDNAQALACAPEVENLIGSMWLKGSFDGVTEQPAVATLIQNEWSSNAVLAKRGAETPIVLFIEAVAWIIATAVAAKKSYGLMFDHGPVWGYRSGGNGQPPVTSTSSAACKVCQTCTKNLTPLVPTPQYVVAPVTRTVSAVPLQTSDLGCLKNTAEDPDHRYFYRKDALDLIPHFCNGIDPYANENHNPGLWDATTYALVPRAGSYKDPLASVTQLRMRMGTAPNTTIQYAKQAHRKADCQALLEIALNACDKKFGNTNPEGSDVMYGGWVTSEGVQWRLQGQPAGEGGFTALKVNPPGNVDVQLQPEGKEPPKRAIRRRAKEFLDHSKKVIWDTASSLVGPSVSPGLSLYAFSACPDAKDCPSGYVAAEWAKDGPPPEICAEPTHNFHPISTNASYSGEGVHIQFSSLGNQSCEFKQALDSTAHPHGNDTLKYPAHLKSGRKLVGGIVCQGGSRAPTTTATCFAPESHNSGTYECQEDRKTTGVSSRSGIIYKMMAECYISA